MASQALSHTGLHVSCRALHVFAHSYGDALAGFAVMKCWRQAMAENAPRWHRCPGGRVVSFPETSRRPRDTVCPPSSGNFQRDGDRNPLGCPACGQACSVVPQSSSCRCFRAINASLPMLREGPGRRRKPARGFPFPPSAAGCEELRGGYRSACSPLPLAPITRCRSSSAPDPAARRGGTLLFFCSA